MKTIQMYEREAESGEGMEQVSQTQAALLQTEPVHQQDASQPRLQALGTQFQEFHEH